MHEEADEWIDTVAESCEGRPSVAEPIVFYAVILNQSVGDVVELSRCPRHDVGYYYCYHCVYNVHLVKHQQQDHTCIINLYSSNLYTGPVQTFVGPRQSYILAACRPIIL